MSNPKENIGKTVAVELGNLIVYIKILDHKVSYGRHRWFVTPVAGSGEVWIQDVDFTKEVVQ